MRTQCYGFVLFFLLIASIVTCATDRRSSQFRGLPEAAQGTISATLGSDIPDYLVQSSGTSLHACNPNQKLESRFLPSGVDVRQGDAHIGLMLRAYGYGEDLVHLPVSIPRGNRNRVVYMRGPVEEWYVNGPIGLEQGFTISQRPASRHGKPLTIALTLSGNFEAALDRSHSSLTLTGHAGHVQLRYAGLSAHDDSGKELPAWIELHADNLLIRVDDTTARYPLVIDPLIQLAELTPSDGKAGDEFGFSVAVNGNTVAVGASQFNSTLVGAAYVFVKGSSGWANMTQTAKLTASNASAGALFGSSIAFAGANTIVVGAPQATVGGKKQGAAYVFVEPAGGWANTTETAHLIASDGAANDDFGYSVSGNGSAIVIGAPQASAANQFQGAAYVFVKPQTGWRSTSHFKAKLTASNGQFDDGFGDSVSISGNTLVSGASGANSGKGASYVFVKPTTGWQSTSAFNAELIASDGQPGDVFGNSVSISGNTIACGAHLAQIGGNRFQGTVYVFVEPASGWSDMTENAKLTASDGQTGDEFGYSVSISGNTVVAGASNDPSTNAAYVFVKPKTGWVTTSHFNAKLTASDASIFGFAVAVSGQTIVSGAIGNQGLQGAAYVF